jgi:phosphopantetheinyl transferase
MSQLLHLEFDHISRFGIAELLNFSDAWCESIVDERRRMESQLARLLLDRSCQKILQKKLTACTFKKNEFGKPYLENHPDLYLSITHSHGYVCTAISDSAIGIDFEKIDPAFSDDLSIAFDEHDWREVSKDTILIYKYFSLKESYSKMTGSGFTQEPSSIKISELQHKTFVNIFENNSSSFIFTLIAKDFEPSQLLKFDKDFSKMKYEE